MGENNGSVVVLPVTWQRAFRIWWALWWRTMLLSVGIGGLLAFAVGFIGGLLSIGQGPTVVVAGIVYIGVLIAVAVLPIQWVFKKQLKNFRIVLIECPEKQPDFIVNSPVSK